MTTKRKRGPVIKTDWVVAPLPIVCSYDCIVFTTKESAKTYQKNITGAGPKKTRIAERKWRVVG